MEAEVNYRAGYYSDIELAAKKSVGAGAAMKVTVLGLWHLGCVTAACCAEQFEVTGLDFNEETVRKLRDGQAPISEPDLDDLIRAGLNSRRLSFTPDAATVANRYQGYREGREPLLAMAYFCLTVLEAGAGGRREAAATYKIHESVLGKLGELTSERGDPGTARKMKAPAMQPLSGAETVWIQEAIKQIIWRLGDQRATTELPTITMADLPAL